MVTETEIIKRLLLELQETTVLFSAYAEDEGQDQQIKDNKKLIEELKQLGYEI